MHFLPTFPLIISAPGWKSETQVCDIVRPLSITGTAVPLLLSHSIPLQYLFKNQILSLNSLAAS